VPTSFLCGIHLRGRVEKTEAARRLGACLPVIESHGLEPIEFAESAWRSASGGLFGGTSLVHGDFAARTGDLLWGAGFTFVPAPEADATLISMMTPGEPLGGGDDAWHWLTTFAEDLLDAIGADLGLINGFTIDPDGESVGGTPAGPEVAPGHPPEALLPWMYWGVNRLAEDGIVDGLRALHETAFRSSGTPRGGWVLEAYDDYSSVPPSELVAAYARELRVPEPVWMSVE